jgi:hypothetical protein
MEVVKSLLVGEPDKKIIVTRSRRRCLCMTVKRHKERGIHFHLGNREMHIEVGYYYYNSRLKSMVVWQELL